MQNYTDDSIREIKHLLAHIQDVITGDWYEAEKKAEILMNTITIWRILDVSKKE